MLYIYRYSYVISDKLVDLIYFKLEEMDLWLLRVDLFYSSLSPYSFPSACLDISYWYFRSVFILLIWLFSYLLSFRIIYILGSS